jgi:Cu-Zn family superoxide dismutase
MSIMRPQSIDAAPVSTAVRGLRAITLAALHPATSFHGIVTEKEVSDMMRSTIRFALFLGSVAAFAAPAGAAEAHATLENGEGKAVGKATLRDATGGVLIRVDFTGLPAGVHAFHVHAVGQCDPPFQSAQGHFNSAAKQHGYFNPKGSHAGDMPNIHVPDSGTLSVEVYLPNVTVDRGDHRLLDGDGAALMVHAGADDYETDPAGNAGDRIACGVIER